MTTHVEIDPRIPSTLEACAEKIDRELPLFDQIARNPSLVANYRNWKKQLRETARTVDVSLIDNVIIPRASTNPLRRGFYSFRNVGPIQSAQ